MKKTVWCAVIIFLAFLWGSASFGAQVTVDLDKLSPEEAAQVLQAQKKAQERTPLAPDKALVILDIMERYGQAFARGIGAAAKELSIQSNEFVKTPVGKWTAFLIIWKVVGQDFWNIIGGILVWMVITPIIIWSFRYFHMSKKVIKKIYDKDTGKLIERVPEYIQRYEFNTNDARVGSAWAHGGAFTIITVVCIIIVF